MPTDGKTFVLLWLIGKTIRLFSGVIRADCSGHHSGPITNIASEDRCPGSMSHHVRWGGNIESST
jgi:hypothetical protein